MITILAGSRNITNYAALETAIYDSGFDITEIVSGNANGVDKLGEKWAVLHSIPITTFIAEWTNFEVQPLIIKVDRYGRKFNAAAGPIRNKKMAQYAEALILLWDGKSNGSADMLFQAIKYNLKIHQMVI